MSNGLKKDQNNNEDQNTNTDPIVEKEEVQQSNDEKIDQDFPGYPHYPAKEDILNPENHTERVNANVENLTRKNLSTQTSNFTSSVADPTEIEDFDDLGIVEGTEADVTKDDLIILGAKDRDMDMSEDEQIESGSAGAFEATEETVTDLDDRDLVDELERTGDDLDLPGDDLGRNDAMDQGDEENDYYSLGGDEKENLEEDPTAQGY